jgi:GNAT superfamily N-acetyltransferase
MPFRDISRPDMIGLPPLHWRAMTSADLPAVMAVAAQVHADYPEDRAVFAERLELAPQGCLSFGDGVGLAGYLVSHPWHAGRPPALNTLLDAIPPDATDWYIHDLALLPRARGSGAGSRIISYLGDLAARAGCARLALVAVNGSVGFWKHHGFRAVHDAALARKLASYDDAARYMVRHLNSDAKPASPITNPGRDNR